MTVPETGSVRLARNSVEMLTGMLSALPLLPAGMSPMTTAPVEANGGSNERVTRTSRAVSSDLFFTLILRSRG